jgi:hypothetical protein
VGSRDGGRHLRQNGRVTTVTPLPPDPDAYDAVRNEHARKRGLPQPYIAGGDDPALNETLKSERRFVRLLVGMTIVIVAGGFVLGIAAALLNIPL